jgi:CheY-like chemotaxis protein
MINDTDLTTLTVLLVEDSDADVVLAREAFEDAHIAVDLVVASDGARAVEILDGVVAGTHARPHLILLDLNLPKVGGLDVLEHVKTTPELQAIPVVVTTTSRAPSDMMGSLQRRADKFVSKPFDPDSFRAIVGTLVTLPAAR